MFGRCLAAVAALILSSCSALASGEVPDALASLCVGTIQNGGSDHPLNVKLTELVGHLRSNGFTVTWSGSASNGVLAARQIDKFAGKTTDIAFETERHPREAGKSCPEGLAVLKRARVNGEALGWYESEDIVLSLAQQYRDAHPLPRTRQPAAATPRATGMTYTAPASPSAVVDAPPSPVLAADDPEHFYTGDYRTCMATGDAGAGVTAGIVDCVNAEIDRQDTVLNSTYRRLIHSMDAASASTLRASERDWIQQRDRKCRAASDEEGGGTLANVTYAGCILDETIRRARWLADQSQSHPRAM